MRTLYESLLGDLDSNLGKGDDVAEDYILEKAALDSESPLRKFIDVGTNKIPDYRPYRIEKTPEKTLIVDPSSRSTIYINPDNHSIEKIIPNIESIKFIRNTVINGGGTKLDSSILSPKIISDYFIFKGVKSVDGIDIHTRDFGNRVMQKIEFDASLISLSNCNINMFTSSPRIWFHNVPKLTNVTSSNVKDISIVYIKDDFGVNVKPWSEKVYNELFDFGYTLDYTVGLDGETKSVDVKNMAGLKKLITAKDFYSRIYTEWPVKLKKNAKMSDFFDVSKFNSLDWVTIHDGRMGIVCENTKNVDRVHRVYFTDMLKNCYYSKATEHIAPNHSDLIHSLPVTADGWRIAVVRL